MASLITGNLAARLRARIDAQASIADRTNKLYDFSRRVAAAATADDVIWASVSHVATTLRCEAVLLRPLPTGELRVVGGFPPEDRLEIRDQSAAQFAWDKGEPAGHRSDTLPTARWFFLPLVAGDRRLGVLGIAYSNDRLFARTDRRLLDALVLPRHRRGPSARRNRTWSCHLQGVDRGHGRRHPGRNGPPGRHRHAARPVTQSMILKSLRGPAPAEDSQCLRVYVRQLRQKLGDDAANPATY